MLKVEYPTDLRSALAARAAGLASSCLSRFMDPATSIVYNMAAKAPAICLRSTIFSQGTKSGLSRNLTPSIAYRHASGLSRLDTKGTRPRDPAKKKKKARTEFTNQSLKDALQFSLCDAMR